MFLSTFNGSNDDRHEQTREGIQEILTNNYNSISSSTGQQRQPSSDQQYQFTKDENYQSLENGVEA